jgi:hypothetical protein
VHVTAGRHRVEIAKAGYRHFAADIDVSDGQLSPLNVSLMPGTP